jgi:hypothetical protein
MAIRIGIGVGLVCVLLGTGCSTSRPHGQYAPIQYEQARQGVELSQDDAGGVEVMAKVDVTRVSRNDAVRNAAWYAKPFVAAKEVTVGAVTYVKENPGKSVLGVAATYIGVRAIQGKLGEDVQGWLGIKSDKGESSTSNNSNQDAAITVSGDNNTVIQTINITNTRTPPPVFVTSRD